MLTFGTAGHIDHGKSSLVRALTSIDPDRLPEEKRRGMTIDLGFAWLKADSGEMVGIVDVPGHEHFVRNVIPGLVGIDAALLVVAADDGWMPQTEEHVQILDLLGVKHGIVALTKVDLIDDPGWLELVAKDISSRLSRTGLREAAIVRVSSINGSGIPKVREAISRLVLKITPRRDIARPRLPVDRVFTMKGSGVVVTGTLANGGFSAGDDVVISPGGRSAHIRSIESYKQQLARAQPGSRVALNLTGIKKGDLGRGDIVLAKEAGTSRIIDAEIRLIPPQSLKNNTELVVYLETRELLGRVFALGGKGLGSDGPALAQVRFERDVATYIGERFILRRQSPVATIGGGTVLDPFAARHRARDSAAAVAFLKSREDLGLEALVLSELAKNSYVEAGELLADSLYSAAEIADCVGHLRGQGRLIAAGPYVVDSGYWQRQMDELVSILRREHSENPLKQGLSLAVLQGYLSLPKEAFGQLVAALVSAGQIIRSKDTVALAAHRPELSPQQEGVVSEIMDIFARSPHRPPTLKELLARYPAGGAVIRFMSRQQMLVELPEGVLLAREQYRRIKDEIIAFLEKRGQVSIQDVNSLFGFSRKYTIPLLSHLDREGVTRRQGDVRVLAKKGV
jgi:selenocysteine-specific elongation factor